MKTQTESRQAWMWLYGVTALCEVQVMVVRYLVALTRDKRFCLGQHNSSISLGLEAEYVRARDPEKWNHCRLWPSSSMTICW